METTTDETKIEVTGPDPVPEPVVVHVCSIRFRHGQPALVPKSWEEAKLWARGRKRTQIGKGVVLFKNKDGYCLMGKRRGRVAVLNVWLKP